VVFSDVVGSTELGERIDPESLGRVMSRYFDEMKSSLERHGGTVEKFIGDAVVGVFGVPVLHEDDAVRAVRAAAEMRESVRALNDELERNWDVRIETRIGVNSGEVMVAGAVAGEALITGDAVNVAARLEQAAIPGDVLIGDSTYRLVKGAVEVQPVELLAVKGKARPVRAWRLVEVLAGDAAAVRPSDSAFIGRDRELTLLLKTFEQAMREQTCQLCTVLGPAGIGKSRLVREFMNRVDAGATVLTGRCLPYGEGITYWPLVEIVRQLAAGDAESSIAQMLAGDEDAELIAKLVAGAVGSAPGGASTAETHWAARKLLELLALRGPLVVVFDDIHWAEPTFLDFVEYLTGFAVSGPLMIVCVARPDLLEARPEWASTRQNSRVTSVDPLLGSECELLIGQLLAAPALAKQTRDRIVARAEGNPLFLEQLSALYLEEWSPEHEVRIPATIQALLATRIDRLQPGERAVLERASVEGRVFHRSALAELSREADREQLSQHLTSLVRKQLIRPDKAVFVSDDAYRFAHVLIRDAAYHSMTKELRAELHTQFAEWLITRTSEASDYDEIIGYHLEQAVRNRSELGPLGQVERELALRAAQRLGGSGRRAFARGDMLACVNLLSRAQTLLSHDEPDVLAFSLELGYALMKTGELSRAQELLSDAIERSAVAGDRRIEAHARMMRSVVAFLISPSRAEHDLLEAAEEARKTFEKLNDLKGLARAWRWIGAVFAMTAEGDYVAAFEHALGHAEEAGDRLEMAESSRMLAAALPVGSTPVAAAIDRCEEMLTLNAGRDEARLPAQCASDISLTLATLYAMEGRFDEARGLAGRAIAFLEELGVTFDLAIASISVAEVESLAGDHCAAESRLRRGYQTLAALDEKAFLSTVAAHLAESLYRQDRYREAAPFTEISAEAAAAGDLHSQIRWRSTRAKILARRGEFDRAESVARDALRRAGQTDFLNVHAGVLLDLAEVLLLAARPVEAAEAARKARSLYERKGNTVEIARSTALLAEVEALAAQRV
jgi:class 3 adenylate cyclase/tetratricopeptide (TPR) repeat protein